MANPLPDPGDRIAKLLARAGVASRRDVERMIAEGRVAIEGKVLDTPAVKLANLKGVTVDGKSKVKQPSGTLSTAEAISVVGSGLALAAHFGDGKLSPRDLVSGISGAVVKDPVQDAIVWREYLETVVVERSDWKDFYKAARESA